MTRRRIILIGAVAAIAAFSEAASAQPPQSSFLIREGYVRSQGARLYYKTMGSGPPLLVVHGGPGLSHHYFLPHLAQLAEHRTLIFFDQRAHGRSSVPRDSSVMRLDNFIRDIETIRTRLNLGKVNLMGHSWGALVTMFYALRFPQNLESLILASPAGARTADLAAGGAVQQSRITREDSLERAEIMQTDGFKRRTPGGMDRFFRNVFKSSFADRTYADSLFLFFPDDYAARGKMLNYLAPDLRDYDLYATLGTLNVRTLIIHGAGDATPQQIVEELRRAFRNSELVILKNSGHFPFIEQKQEFLKIIGDFLEK